MRVLIVEDEIRLADALAQILKENKIILRDRKSVV